MRWGAYFAHNAPMTIDYFSHAITFVLSLALKDSRACFRVSSQSSSAWSPRSLRIFLSGCSCPMADHIRQACALPLGDPLNVRAGDTDVGQFRDRSGAKVGHRLAPPPGLISADD